VGIFRIDLSGTLTYANAKWREITGLEESLDDSTGERLIRGVHPDDRETISKQWRHAIENRKRCSFEVRWGRPDSFRWAMGELVPEVFYEEVHGFIGVLTDVTERRQLEAEKLDAAEEIRAQQELAIGAPQRPYLFSDW
jgi:PAS domain S-box-containing protein